MRKAQRIYAVNANFTKSDSLSILSLDGRGMR
jgi:hypothetical protein